jgi:hypothetical protein
MPSLNGSPNYMILFEGRSKVVFTVLSWLVVISGTLGIVLLFLLLIGVIK